MKLSLPKPSIPKIDFARVRNAIACKIGRHRWEPIETLRVYGVKYAAPYDGPASIVLSKCACGKYRT